jgi:threonine dehydratase
VTANRLVEATAPTHADIVAAARRLDGFAVRTPLLESPLLNKRAGARLLVKAEPLQRTGSFKFRGAFNKISQLDTRQKSAGIVAYSSGNHAQGVAHAAQLNDVKATIVMPRDAPQVKTANTRSYGAEIVLYDRQSESREAIGEQISAERGATLVPPYDDPDIVAGQGTVGLEALDQLNGITPDLVLCGCGGGGLIAGVSTALRQGLPTTPIHPVEPEGFDDTARSLAAGARQANDAHAHSICDALLAPTPGALTFAINRRLLATGLVVSEPDVLAAMAAAFSDLKLVVEPGGVVALAAVLADRDAFAGKTVLLILSGGNVDPDLFAKAIAS